MHQFQKTCLLKLSLPSSVGGNTKKCAESSFLWFLLMFYFLSPSPHLVVAFLNLSEVASQLRVLPPNAWMVVRCSEEHPLPVSCCFSADEGYHHRAPVAP